VKDVQTHLRHSRPIDGNEYMQELADSVQQMVGSVYRILTKERAETIPAEKLPQNATRLPMESL